MKTTATITKNLERISTQVDTGDQAADQSIREAITAAIAKIERAGESLKRRAMLDARNVLATHSPDKEAELAAWLEALKTFCGSTAVIAEITGRSVRSVEGWFIGRPVPEDAVEAVRLAIKSAPVRK